MATTNAIIIDLHNEFDWKIRFVNVYCHSNSKSRSGLQLKVKGKYAQELFCFRFLGLSNDNDEAPAFFLSVMEDLLEQISLLYTLPGKEGYPTTYVFPIRRYSDYQSFFRHFVKDGTLRKGALGKRFRFEISQYQKEQKKADELRFFYFLLIARKFWADADFSAIINTELPFAEFIRSPDFYRLNLFFYLYLGLYGNHFLQIRSLADV